MSDTTTPVYRQGLPAQIRDWLTANPGLHRTRDIAVGLGVPEGTTRSEWTINVGRAVGRMWKEGKVTRSVTQKPGAKRGLSTYSLPPA